MEFQKTASSRDDLHWIGSIQTQNDICSSTGCLVLSTLDLKTGNLIKKSDLTSRLSNFSLFIAFETVIIIHHRCNTIL